MFSASDCCGSRCFLRYVLMYVFVRIRYSQALRFVPGRYWWNAAKALAKVSWTRSSASAGFRVIRSAAEYSWSRYCRASASNRRARACALSASGALLVSSVITDQRSRAFGDPPYRASPGATGTRPPPRWRSGAPSSPDLGATASTVLLLRQTVGSRLGEHRAPRTSFRPPAQLPQQLDDRVGRPVRGGGRVERVPARYGDQPGADRQHRAHLVRDAERVALALDHEQRPAAGRRQLLGPRPLGPSRRVQREGEADAGVGRHRLGRAAGDPRA